MDPLASEPRIASGLDDAEKAASGAMHFDSSDLELVDDPTFNVSDQTEGLRFTGLDISAGAVITGAGERTAGRQCTSKWNWTNQSGLAVGSLVRPDECQLDMRRG